MGRLARIALQSQHYICPTWGDIDYLVEELNAARRTIREFQEALHQRGHVMELQFEGNTWAIEHTVECRMNGILNCPIHMKVTAWVEEFGPPLYDLDDGRYYVELQQNGEMSFTALEE